MKFHGSQTSEKKTTFDDDIGISSSRQEVSWRDCMAGWNGLETRWKGQRYTGVDGNPQ